jgi:hypothetical protein
LSVETPTLVQAMETFRQAMWIRPGEFGFDGDLPRHGFLTLEDLGQELGKGWVGPLLQKWMVRIQPIRFRQDADFRGMVDAYLGAAGILVRADAEQGKARDVLLRDFKDAWQTAHTAYRDMEKRVAVQQSLDALEGN